MKLFRSAIFALSVVLVLLGPSATATTNYSHPELSVTENRILSLQETISQLVIDTIEDAIRQGGLALFGEEFRIDSSLSWVSEESSDVTLEGEIDAVFPFYKKGEHVIFTQPGLVFWKGQEEEDRVDGNFGVVYRTNLANTPIGIDAIGGASLFYDWDFHRVGHSRLGIGADIQSGIFHGAFNYYHPLSGERDGQREGFIERALRGMDLRFALERDTVRAGARLGYWRYDGGEDVTDEWRTSVGFDAGLQIVPGVFIEAEWEKHKEDLILDQRLNLGLAFRFSLPEFEGASYGNGGMSTNLYNFAEREKNILYEERYEEHENNRSDAVEHVTISDGIRYKIGFAESTMNVEEGNSVNLMVLLTDSDNAPLISSGQDLIQINLISTDPDMDITFTSDNPVIPANSTLTDGMWKIGDFSVVMHDEAESEKRVTITMNTHSNFPSNSWRIDPDKNSVEIVIAPSSNSVSFASSSTTTFNEGETSGNIMIQLTNPSTVDIPILITISERFTTAGFIITDIYTVMPVSPATYVDSNLIIPAGEISASFTIGAPNDTDNGDKELAIILLEGSTNSPALLWPSGWGRLPPASNPIAYYLEVKDND